MILRSGISLGILAGGRASRLGGADKAWCEFQGRSLLERSVSALGDGYRERLISYPRDDLRLRRLDLIPVADHRPGYPGPLAGLESLLATCQSPWLLSVPVDTRWLPADLCERLAAVANDGGAVAFDTHGQQPLVALWRTERSLSAVRSALDRGEAAAHALAAALALAPVHFDDGPFGNLNTPEDFQD